MSVEETRSGIKVPLYPTAYILNADRYCWWLTVSKPKKDNPFELTESPSLGYFGTPGACLRSLPKKVLASEDMFDLKALIAAVESMEKTVIEVGKAIDERLGELNGNRQKRDAE